MSEKQQKFLTEEQISKILMQAKRAAITLTCIYSPPLLYITWLFIGISGMFFDDPTRSSWSTILQLILGYCFLIPVPIPIYKTWARYFRMRNKSTCPLLLIPTFYYVFVLYFMVKLICIEVVF